ncbi:PIN domain-containing protein [bacterium]|jgi:predicted nucleic-acid-binding protein|nr:PIN domain-containing protein [bacterium]
MNVPTCFVDTNVLVRYLTADDAQKAEAVEQLLVHARDGEVSLITSDIVIAELVWVLSSFYRLEKAIIAELLRAILNTEGFKVDNSDVIEVSLDTYETESIDFITSNPLISSNRPALF